MDNAMNIRLAECDSEVVSALRLALDAMQLTHGARVLMNGVAGHLNYERQMLAMRAALSLLGIDPGEAVSPPETRYKLN